MIIGLTGSYGAGKGAVVDYLVNKKGFKHFSARAFITESLTEKDIPVNRENLINMANKLRFENGPAYIIESLHKRANKTGEDVVIESLRANAEVEYIKNNGGTVIGVDADPKLRYERMTKRGTETDNVSYDEWIEQQRVETNPDDPTKQNIYEALKESDFIIMNNGTLEDLHKEIEDVLKKMLS